MSKLELQDGVVSVGDRVILSQMNMSIGRGEVHIVMGVNGSGKSSLASSMIKRPNFTLGATIFQMDGKDLLNLDTTEIATSGLFVASQYPTEIPGVSNAHFLRMMANKRRQACGRDLWSAGEFLKEAKARCQKLGLSPDFLSKSLNHGMSGGEKKRNELLQLSFFEPRFAILDEIDSGLDIDAWGKSMQFIKDEQARVGFGLVIVTHYAKTAKFFAGASVHVIEKGSLTRHGGIELAELIDAQGFGVIES